MLLLIYLAVYHIVCILSINLLVMSSNDVICAAFGPAMHGAGPTAACVFSRRGSRVSGTGAQFE